jgi:HTH-type transcriptional regulator/antitoxin HigA
MSDRTLNSESDYRKALATVSALVDGDPAPDTPDGLRLRALAKQIERYEALHGWDPAVAASPDNGGEDNGET